MASSRRVGEALTYAGGDALFSLVGIAGEEAAETADTPGRVAMLARSCGNPPRASSGRYRGELGGQPPVEALTDAGSFPGERRDALQHCGRGSRSRSGKVMRALERPGWRLSPAGGGEFSASGIEARRAETRSGSVYESPARRETPDQSRQP
jgi:hypothetical protein